MNAEILLARAEEKLNLRHTTLEKANAVQLHDAIAAAAMEALAPQWTACEQERSKHKQAAYLSAEFLVGRMVFNNLYCLGVLDETRRLLQERGVNLADLEEIEDDAFGNGGLGRLAACFLDSAATHGIPLTGYGLRYRFGLFKQRFVAFKQVEEPDDWAKYGDPWSVRRDDLAVTVPMKSGSVLAVPYDMPVIGFGGSSIGTLRLWQTESLKEIDFQLFNDQRYAAASSAKNRAEDVTKFLYPNDTKRAGKMMRVKQQYVMCSASLQDMLRSYHAKHGSDYSHLAEEWAVQLNDTHPVMAIPELIRLLEDDGVAFVDGLAIARQVFAYTNHTVMQEALEKWDLSLLSSVCPEIVRIMRDIDEVFRADMAARNLPVTDQRCIIENGRIHMAYLAVYATHATNGVAEIHSRILKDSVLKQWYEAYPERFQNKTNGITQRRWLGLCNPELSRLIADRIGAGFVTELNELANLKPLIDDALCHQFIAVKREKKRQLADVLLKEEGVVVDPGYVFDVQVKRLHEYKRQLMNALSIMAIYQGLQNGSLTDLPPVLFVFGAKAAPGYQRAKAIIRYINAMADRINRDPDMDGRMKVVFVQNYNCSYAEKIIPAADISEQISPAGTEASGTGNMKLMLNGAVTLGTFDGANVEIVEQAGRENNFIFGATVEELRDIENSYDPKALLAGQPVLAAALETLHNGTFADEDGALAELYTALTEGTSWHKADHYYVIKDFPSYLETKLAAIRAAGQPQSFARLCLNNVAAAGKFSSDRTVKQYAEEIWGVKPM